MINSIQYKPFGARAILIEWKAEISQTVLADMLAFKEKIVENTNNLADCIVGYHSLTIIYNILEINFETEKNKLQELYQTKEVSKKSSNYCWKIPVCYNLEFGLDLEEIAVANQLSIKQIIELHTAPTYTVFFIGFLPGFPYLSGLNEQLFVNRKPNPRLKVPKGALGIGGKQTGVYPHETPGGWNIIGRTPIELFNISKTNPCLLKAGDKIKFESILKTEFYAIQKSILYKKYQLSKVMLDD